MGASATADVMTLASTQHGAVGVEQLAALGASRRWLDNLTRRGVLERTAPGVYTVTGSADTWHRRLTVGLLALGERSWVSHEAAARLHGFDRAMGDAVEFTVERQGRGRRMPFTVHTTTALQRLDCVTVDGFRCLSATRTIIDLARARVPAVRLEAAIDSAVRQGLSATTAVSLRLSELRGRGRWGAPALDRLLVDSGGHSRLERLFLALVREAGLPRPTTQVIHRVNGRTVARVDFLFDAYGVVIEVSGRRGHSSPGERARDAQRRNELQDLGRKVYEYTWEDVTERRPHVERTLVARLHAAGWRA